MNRSARRHIPSYSLYGEMPGAIRLGDALHIEDIQSRSRKYLWKIFSHRHTGLCQCVYVTAGPVVADIEGARAEFEGPTVVIIPAGAVHGFGFRADSQGYVLTINLDRLLSMASSLHRAPIAALFSVPRVIGLASDPVLAARAAGLFGNLIEEFRQPESPGPQVGWLACSVLWILSSGTNPTTAIQSPDGYELDRLRRFRLLVETHYQKHWPVKRYARQLALSESSLNRICRNLTGGTAFDIVQQRLALEARRRLVYVAGSVAGVAAELGFKDPAYFCRFFRRHAGVSPTEFRRHQEPVRLQGDG
jgi:AraC family transcriptional regulator, transcriptional activator of pobA